MAETPAPPKGPAYKRLVDQIKAHILKEKLTPGEDRLPSAKELEDMFAATPGVVRLALRELDTEGVIATGQGKPALILRRPDQPDERRSAEYVELKQLICDLRADMRSLREEVDGLRQQNAGS